MKREELLDQWLEGQMISRNESRKDFLMRAYKVEEDTALALVDWVWNAGFNAGLEEGTK